MFKKILIFLFLLITIILPTSVYAADLDIYCYENQKPVIIQNSTPLFNLSGFMPGDSEQRSIYMKNYDNNNSCRIYIDAEGNKNILTDKIEVDISDIYANSLSALLNKGNILIGEINPSGEIYRQFTLSFNSGTNNDYQDKKASFDLRITSQWGGDQITNQEENGEVEGVETEKIILNPEEVREVVMDDKGDILGLEDECKEYTLWWLPIILQFLLTIVITFFNKWILKKKYSKLFFSIILGVLSYLLVNWIGCGCNSIWICENHWIINFLISIFPTVNYLFKK